jgi:Domain of unknown function (DUF4351)
MATPLDSPWKEILESYFPQFMAFFFPEAYSQIDWNCGFEFLDGELQQITREAETGKRITDKLVKVYLRNGKEQWIAAHIEIQNQKEDKFGERIFIYFARLRDKFQREVASFAVLGDTDKSWRPDSFATETLGCNLQFFFSIAKLVDYKQRKEELEASDNPFAVVVQAHLAAQATKNKESQQRRRKQKFALTTKLYEKGLSRQEVINLFRFIDWAMALPPELEEAFRNDLFVYKGGENMAYITSIERMAMAKGKADLVIKQLNFKVGQLSEETLARIVSLPIEQLEKLAEDLLNFSDSNDLADWLERS